MIKPKTKQQWLRSSYCGTNTCVEVAQHGDRVLVRDSKSPESTPMEFTLDEWVAFVSGARNGEFDFA